MSKQKFISAVNFPDGRRFEKSTKVEQMKLGGRATIISFIDNGIALVEVECPDDKRFAALAYLSMLLPVKPQEDTNNGEGRDNDSSISKEDVLDEPTNAQEG
jgi:hypothetical protein